MSLTLPIIPAPWLAVAKVVPAWVYVGAGASVVALGGLAWASHHGAAHQAQKDAPVIAQAQGAATYSNATSALTTSQLTNSSNRTAAEARTRESTDAHVQRVQDAADSQSAFSEFLNGLHDGEPATAPGQAPGVPGGPKPAAAPHPAR